MYFLPSWDFFLSEEVKKVKNNLYYFSGTMIGPIGRGLQNVDFNCGKTADEFNEEYLQEAADDMQEQTDILYAKNSDKGS